MSGEVDRIEAQEVADLLGICVSAIPEDHDALTTQLWDAVGLNDGHPLPESIETRWELIQQAIYGGEQ